MKRTSSRTVKIKMENKDLEVPDGDQIERVADSTERERERSDCWIKIRVLIDERERERESGGWE